MLVTRDVMMYSNNFGCHFLGFFARKIQLCYSRHHLQKHEHTMVYVISGG